jgi:hypothetical protein
MNRRGTNSLQATALFSRMAFPATAFRLFVFVSANSYNLARFTNMPRWWPVQYLAIHQPD